VDEWEKLGEKKMFRITADRSGTPFFIAQKQSNQLFEWYNDHLELIDMGNDRQMEDIAAGPPGHLYVLGPPLQNSQKTIYKYGGEKKWHALPGKRADSIAVGPKGHLYITAKGKVYMSHDFVEE
jgi:hypothetical protein